MKKLFIISSIIAFGLVQIFTNWSVFESFSILIFIYFFFSFVDNMGKKLVILDVTILITILSCLILPIAGYHYFTSANRLSRMWVTYMRVPSDEYYSYMVPATLAMIVGMKLPIFFTKQTYHNHLQYLVNVKVYLAKSRYLGLGLVMVGMVSSLFEGYVPAVVAQVFFLLKYLLFVGVFYCMYSDFPNKKSILIVVFCMLVARAISGGMFGEMIYMGALSFILIMLGNKMSFVRKLSFFSVGIFMVLVLQAVKPAFRKQTWTSKADVNKFSVFASIFSEKVTSPSTFFSNDKELFTLYVRFNQGQLISNVLNSVPRRFPYADGETIITSLGASIVPRVLWPDKPKAGGEYNFKRFLGIKLKGWSANISPFGEAWGNFGNIGGIVFIFFFGLLFNFLFQWLLKIAVHYPSVVLWLPYLFFYSVVIENDVMTMLNSFTKAAILMYFLYKISPRVFKVKL